MYKYTELNGERTQTHTHTSVHTDTKGVGDVRLKVNGDAQEEKVGKRPGRIDVLKRWSQKGG